MFPCHFVNIFSASSQNTLVYRFYLQKHAELEFELQSLRELTHPQYTNTIQMFEEQFKTELETEEIVDQVILIDFLTFVFDWGFTFPTTGFEIMSYYFLLMKQTCFSTVIILLQLAIPFFSVKLCNILDCTDSANF